MDETPVEQESASGEGVPAKEAPLSRVEKVLFIDWLCFLVASGLLLVHFMVSRNGSRGVASPLPLRLSVRLVACAHCGKGRPSTSASICA